ncbi:regulatory protein RecX, partial [candidate division KSB1 bacterium]|nr:regulatory protein RecX [candidate division KSB1 bacterium]
EDDSSEEEEYRAALAKAYRLLGLRARSEKELREALTRAKYKAEVVETVLQKCRVQHFVDDAKFAQQFVQSRLRNRPMGRERLKIELRNKGIADAIITAVLDEAFAPEDTLTLANQLADKQRKRLANLPAAKAQQRLADFLRRRGFDWETIQRTKLWKEFQSSDETV